MAAEKCTQALAVTMLKIEAVCFFVELQSYS